MRKLVVVACVILITACREGTPQRDANIAASEGDNANLNQGDLPFATACPASKQGNFGDSVICEEGDPAVLAALPAWAKPPQEIAVSNTSISQNGIGYAADYDGPLSDIEPHYRKQVAREPGIQLKPQDGSKMLVGSKIGDTSGTYLSLTPIQKSSGGEKVEIRFYQNITQVSPPAK